jgi:hypothetical protein
MMVFLALVTTALFALIAAQFYAYKASQGSRQRQIAANLAYSYLNSAEDALRRDFYRNQALALTRLTDPAGFRVALTDYYEPDGLENLKHITCSIYWDEAATVREYRACLDLYRGPD